MTIEDDHGPGISCPFCWESDFDLMGLKGHLEHDCESYRATFALGRLNTRPAALSHAAGQEVVAWFVCTDGAAVSESFDTRQKAEGELSSRADWYNRLYAEPCYVAGAYLAHAADHDADSLLREALPMICRDTSWDGDIEAQDLKRRVEGYLNATSHPAVARSEGED